MTNTAEITATGSRFRALVVEDSATVRIFLRHWLTREIPGIEVLEAEDGRTAFQSLTRHSVQLIVTDLNMPGMDGGTFVDKLRSNSVLKRKPVLVLSGGLTPAIQAAAALDPLLCLVAKPANTETLNHALHGLLARANSAVAVAA